MYEAARLGDGIEHTGALAGFVLGAVCAVALIAAVTILTGGLCGFLLGFAAGLFGSAIISAGEEWGRSQSSPSGAIETASPNVFINGRKAAFVEDSVGSCDQHSPIVRVAEGSGSVFINGKPAARKGDKLTCGARVASGSNNVFIGGGTTRYLPVDEEVKEWMHYGADILMGIAGGGRGLINIGRLGLQKGLKAALPCAMKFMAGVFAGDLAGRYVIGPAVSRALGGLFGNPVDAITGRKLLPDEIDFSLPGLMPLEWSRFYASDLTVDSVLGQGWVLPWEQSLRSYDGFVYLTDNQGRTVPFVALQPNERIYNPHEDVFLVRTAGGHYLLQTLDNTFFYFGEVPEDNTPVPLQRMENAYGHYLHFTRSPDGVLTDITAPGDLRVHLHYDHPLGRLTSVKRIVGDAAVETLVRYDYDENGQLERVTNRNRDIVRNYRYSAGLMVQHRHALGLTCEYRWAQIDGQPRVVEHWTDDGERYHFEYDTAARTTRIVDALGRQALIHYNADKRVTASQDFGGERYAIDLDAFGNMTGLTLPDGNRLSFTFDEYSRLLEEVDPIGRKIRYDYFLLTPLVKTVVYPDASTWKGVYDDKGALVEEYDALGQRTEYAHTENGLVHTITDATRKSKYLWWNAQAQVEKFQDCSGKTTLYRYNDRHQLVAVTDAAGNTTTLERKPDGEVLRIDHPDGISEAFTYNALGQVTTHTDGKGQKTSVWRNSRGLPMHRSDANGNILRYSYDEAIRLTALSNENASTYTFAYDASDRLIEEVRIDNLTRRFSYNLGGQLTQLQEIGYGEQAERPERFIEFERDPIGRLTAKSTQDARQAFEYDVVDRLVKIERTPTEVGRKIGVNAEALSFEYDLLGRLIKETTPQGALGFDYDPLSNLTTLTLSDGRKINHLYYGSGHLHQLNIDGQVISDFERDDLHQEIYRTQGKLTSRFGYDPMGRKAWQYASTVEARKLSSIHSPLVPGNYLLGDPRSPIERHYHYDPAGELVRTLDKLRGETRYEYKPDGQLLSRSTGRLVDDEQFRYDAAANRLDLNTRRFDKVRDNRLKKLNGHEFDYDPWGNLVTKRSGAWQTDVQEFRYDSENRLVHTRCWEAGRLVSEGRYQYDSLGRRIKKTTVTAEEPTPQEKTFQWQGLRLLREQVPQGQRLYLYEQDSYAPLARIDDVEGEEQKTYYFHTDQIGTPLEMSDAEGRIVWQATFKAWGEVQSLEVGEVEQNLRFQGQYFDGESGLHYNTFRYYDPRIGRFLSQDPIGLRGGLNLFKYGNNPIAWVDPAGLAPCRVRTVNGTKIHGKGQVDGTPGHDQFSEAIANKLAMSGRFTDVYLNRSYNFAKGRGISTRRPDVMAVDVNGRVHAIELASKTDMGNKFPRLKSRNHDAMSGLPNENRGDIFVFEHPYNPRKIKVILDDFISDI